MKNSSYVDVFQGFDEIKLPAPRGIAAAWFFIKAQCGNNNPGALLPFGRISVAPYTGGYPTGYGDRLANYAGSPGRFEDGNRPFGFSHLHHTGTGAVGYYYNYAVTAPFYDKPGRKAPSGERAVPGLFEINLDDIACAVTVDEKTALHRYTFSKENGKILIDFANDGLTENHGNTAPESVNVKIVSPGTVCAKIRAQGIDLYIAAACKDSEASLCDIKIHSPEQKPPGNTAAIFAIKNKTAHLRVAISLRCEENALLFLEQGEKNFETAAKKAAETWEKALSVIDIDADEETRQIFYSNLYHSLVKPSDFSGESFIYEGKGPFVTDLTTLWDIYKTQLPLVYTFFPDISEKISETLMSSCESLGFILNCFGLSDDFNKENIQARMLGGYALLTAYHYGIKMDPRRMLRVIHQDLHHPGKEDFTKNGRCESLTWVLDMADCCAFAADVARELGERELFEDFSHYAQKYLSAFDPKTGLLYSDSSYYEGGHVNYSFRLCRQMEERIRLAGGNESFVKLLDSFFGYGAEAVAQPTAHDPEYIEKGLALGRFEGFNNEPDMETPYAYLYAGRHDRACEVLRTGMDCQFTTGRGGIPGNNDSGALSSCYIWNALGLFPVAGSDYLLLGSPILNSAELHLPGGKSLIIKAHSNSKDAIYVEKIKLNGEDYSNITIPAKILREGGKIEFFMSENPN